MANKKSLTIPHDQMRPGIDLCLLKSHALNEDANRLRLSSAQALLHASVLFSYAVEELGKAALIHDAGQQAKRGCVPIPQFYSHQAKLSRAEEFVGEDSLKVRAGAFSKSVFSRGFDVGAYASVEKDRLDGLYVDWQAHVDGTGRWKADPPVDPELLAQGIAALRDAIVRASAAPPDAVVR